MGNKPFWSDTCTHDATPFLAKYHPFAMAERGFVGPVLQRCGQATALKDYGTRSLSILSAPGKGVTGAKELIAAYLIDHQARPRIRPMISQC
jgi:hypothetical protein